MTEAQGAPIDPWADGDPFTRVFVTLADQALTAVLHAIAVERDLEARRSIHGSFSGSYERDIPIGMDDGNALIRLTVLPGDWDGSVPYTYLVVLDADVKPFGRHGPTFDITRFSDVYDRSRRDGKVPAPAPDSFAGRIIEPIRRRRGGGPLHRERDGSLSFGLTPD